MTLLKLALRCTLLLVAALATLTILFPHWLDFKDTVFANYRAETRQSTMMQGPPNDWQINIAGEISLNARYDVHVMYSATNTDQSCQRYVLGNGSYEPKGKWFKYTPQIKQGQHSLVVPLDVYKPSSPCVYRPETITLGVSRNQEKSLDSDTLFYAIDPERASQIEHQELQDPIDKFTLTLECVPTVRDGLAVDMWSCTEDSDPIAKPIRYRNIDLRLDIDLVNEADHARQVTLRSQEYRTRNMLSDLVRLVHSYQTAAGRFPTPEEGNQLLSRAFDFEEVVAKEKRYFVDEFVKDQQRYFEQNKMQGDRIEDLWGNPIQFVSPARHSDENFELISLGADGVTSDDDIWMNNHHKSNIEPAPRSR